MRAQAALFNVRSTKLAKALTRAGECAAPDRGNLNRPFRICRYKRIGNSSLPSYPTPMPPLIDPMELDARRRSNGFAGTLAFFVGGIVVGLGLVSGLGGEFVAGLSIVAVLSCVLSQLSRVSVNTRKRVTAGEAS